MLKYLLDEHVSHAYRKQLLRREPSLTVRIIVTNNRSTMPVHLADHLAEGRHVPGIFILNPQMGFGETIEELILLAMASVEGEFRDQIAFLPYKG
ncbi:MAG: DUF5615 family PIN-like protein [Blastocatellia bacterium]